MIEVKIKNNCVFLRGPIEVFINGILFNIQRSRLVSSNIPKSIPLSIEAKQYWVSSAKTIEVDASTTNISIIISERIPPAIFFSAFGLMLVFYLLFAVSIIGHVIPTIYTMVIVLISLIYAVFFRKSYFKISYKKNSGI